MTAVALVVLTLAVSAAGQEHARVNGTVQSIADQSLMLLSDTPVILTRPLLGLPIAPGSAPRPRSGGLYVDLRQLSPAEYGTIRAGDRVSVAGVVSDEGLIATSISLRTIPQSP